MLGKILIADDDERINELLQEIFSMENYATASAYDGEKTIQILEQDAEIELVILDVMMPGLNGWDILEYIKRNFDVKVLMLSALSDAADEVRGLRLGADDYVAKPFSRAVLIERVKRLVREQKKEHAADYHCGDLSIRQRECKVYLKEKEIRLTMKEYQLLLFLMKNSKVVLERDHILNRIWGIDYDGNDRTLDTHIKMLRHSLGEYSTYIRTIRGIGYCFDGDVREE